MLDAKRKKEKKAEKIPYLVWTETDKYIYCIVQNAICSRSIILVTGREQKHLSAAIYQPVYSGNSEKYPISVCSRRFPHVLLLPRK